MKIYAVKVFQLGADSPSTFYFEDDNKAKECYNAYERADDIVSFDDEEFPLDMLSDYAF